MTIKLSREAITALCCTIAALIIPVIAFLTIKFQLKQTPDERSLLSFSPTPITLSPRTWREASFNCPVTVTLLSSENRALAAPLTDQTRKQSEADPAHLPQLTFILYEGNPKKDTAILDGHLLRQGNSLNGWRVTKIEQKRVQLAGRKGTQWLSME
ncbi:hypothetical protein SAMN02745119_01728 [Trichlorobacter thiogenes]|uniref:Uncharacterized protein n=1 Tax=Trichlorobacter thiogenes TaxID=115783 RepID=A0A1T4NTK4_9BACT|nr:hypothetical protein [Trichlorobacter thiogenes]SJZ82581.1 hypothetical protein SAMN02745119_01728 [Trichlorobacter thiogenes]